MNVKIVEVENRLDLHCRYDGQINPQRCFISLDTRDGEMRADYDPEIGNGTFAPSTVWHNLVHRYPIPCVTADAANMLMHELIPFAKAVLNNHGIEWDGSNWKGMSADEGRSVEALEKFIEEYPWGDGDFIQEMDASEWFQERSMEGTLEDLNTLGLETMIEESEREALEAIEYPLVLRNTRQYLIRLREENEDES